MTEQRRLFDNPPHRRDTIASALRSALETEPGVIFAYLHGSFLTNVPFRDIDIAAYLDIGQPPDDGLAHHIPLRVMRLTARLAAALHGHFERGAPPVDVRALNEAPLGFCYQALRNGRLLIGRDEPLRVEWVARTVSRYLDLRPLREQALKEAMTACR